MVSFYRRSTQVKTRPRSQRGRLRRFNAAPSPKASEPTKQSRPEAFIRDRLKTLGFESYEAYRGGQWWRSFSASVKRGRHVCPLCFLPAVHKLVVHHLTYERLGCERRSDVVVMHKLCHSRLHNQLNKLFPNLNCSAKVEHSRQLLQDTIAGLLSRRKAADAPRLMAVMAKQQAAADRLQRADSAIERGRSIVAAAKPESRPLREIVAERQLQAAGGRH